VANPEHQEQLDSVDKISVSLYRLGWLLLCTSFGCAAYSALFSGATWQPLWLLAAAIGLQAYNLHLYSKAIRYLMQGAAWLGMWLAMAFYLWHWPMLAHAALACFYFVASGLAFKESFCFQLGWLRWLGALLVLDYLLRFSPWLTLRGAVLLSISALAIYIAYQKCRQPMHYDIGKRDNYQI
jgi:uncharacterized integral membrane protein